MTGSQPGALDPTQALRLLNDPHSLWTFASFDPYIGAPSARFRNPAFKEKDVAAPKRVVVEQRPDGKLYWRFVPKAHLEPGVTDEGQFPRQVELCGSVCRPVSFAAKTSLLLAQSRSGNARRSVGRL